MPLKWGYFVRRWITIKVLLTVLKLNTCIFSIVTVCFSPSDILINKLFAVFNKDVFVCVSALIMRV